MLYKLFFQQSTRNEKKTWNENTKDCGNVVGNNNKKTYKFPVANKFATDFLCDCSTTAAAAKRKSM